MKTMRILMAGTGSGGEVNFKRTVLAPVSLEHFADVLTFTQRQLLEAKHGKYARVWGLVPAKKGPSVSAAAELRPGHQVWFHHDGAVHTVSEVVTVFCNIDFDRALWDQSSYPASGFVFTMTEPQNAVISKTAINKLLGYRADYAWANNRLLNEKVSALLAEKVHLSI
jgi:hypothetical protein